MATRSIYTFIACEKPWIDEKNCALRISWAQTMLQRYPTKEHWRLVRFSDETHFGWGPASKQLIIRRKGTQWRGHPDCVVRQETRSKSKKEAQMKRVHYWGAISFDFKSELIRYDMDGNQNGKLTQQAYIDQILEPEVSKWCSNRSEWVLKEDNDSGYRNKDSNNLVQKWKRDHGITQSNQSAHRCYFNCPRSPDLAIIEDGWSYPKNYVKKRSH